MIATRSISRRTRALTHHRRKRLHNHHRHRAGQPHTETVARLRRIQPDLRNMRVDLPRYPRECDDKHHPKNHAGADHVRHRADDELEEHDIHDQHKIHRPIHPAPALENVAGIPAPAHRKRQRRHERQDAGNDIPLADVHEQLDHLDD